MRRDTLTIVTLAFPMDASQINTAIDYLMAATMNCVALLPVLGGVLECSKKGWLKLFIPQGDDERTAEYILRSFIMPNHSRFYLLIP